MRAVIDTNVFVSGIFWKGISNRIIISWRERKFDLVNSLKNVEELIKVLKFFKIEMSDEFIKEWVTLIVENSIIVDVVGKIKVVKDDPTDDKFIETALNGKADYIISQDRHLLDIKEFEGIKVVTPEEFLRFLKTG
jgi:putative PIN family toxin of toxin-antitoxin system